jgi:hypothetical protein
MTHLSPSEFVDFADGALDAAPAAHLERCGVCREHAQTLLAMMRDAASDGVPDPSPLFWDHFQQRVQRAIAAEPAPRRPWFALRAAPALATVMVAIAIASAALYPRRADDPRSIAPAESGTTSVGGPSIDRADDPAWALLREVASDMAIEDAHAAGMTLRPGEAETAVLQLTPDERNELGRLLQDALKRAGA